MASAQPIAGAMYHWSYALAPLNIRRFTTWMQGWVTWAGWISMTIGMGSGTAAWVSSLLQLNYPNYVPELWHSTMIIWAMVLICTCINLFKFGKLVPWIETVAGCLHITLFLVFSIVLLALAPKHSADFVFSSRVDSASTSGWTNDFVGWNLGLQTSVWCFVGFDAAVHLSEELRRPATTVPWVMVLANAVNGLMAWLFILVILFSMGDPDDALTYLQPMLAVLLNATGSRRIATAMASLILIINICAMIVNIASMSRLSWSWARDGALPKVLAYVDSSKRVPARAVLFSVFIVVLLSLVNIGSNVALQVFGSLSTLAISTPPQMGPWTMGRLGIVVNIFALVYTAYIIIWLPFPITIPINAENFNYSSPIFGLVVLVALGWWGVKRKSWPGLREDVIEIAINKA
ncbi:Putative amino acid/polyamine transporter I [Septoria linicola]|uniref:Amino acid/polyamine transporter I n=1 Tax=Septoria linicola TaxID=215465 RepID=A0A9Q9EJ81_9PEZI|nr:putative amino acid/polyamine transporter I [Septoria linicola]USW51929.1 Putative amino acid/polyamine transporter I [Septoria linicola]